jgi:serine/threonine-protein kinase
MDQILLDNLKANITNLRITGELKVGGQKVVFSSYYKGNIKTVFKVINTQQAEEKARALREINILSSLKSKYFPILYDYGEYKDGKGNIIFVIEEYIDGNNLRDILNSLKPARLDLTECKRIMSSLLDALFIIEPLHLVHRDIKPENIIVTSSSVVLIDFGIARDISKTSLTETYAIYGPMTPGYAPPEQIRNEKRKISFRTDLFSLGLVFYEILVGHNPFIVGTSCPGDALNKTIAVNPPSLVSMGFDKTFDEFIFKCIEKSCHRRPASLIQAKLLFDKIIWGF